ncbi:MAG TPA: penicillin acylase family protein [Terriglobales bacterium]
MSSHIAVREKAPPRARGWRWLGVSLVALVVVAIALVAWALSIAHSALPQLDGSVSVSGLSGPVSITRDSHGIPTIDAATLDDLFYAQGYVAAQDRLFQMDLMRRAAAGELSEIVGDATLTHDRRQRILGIRAQAEKGVAALDGDDRRYLGAYARGINAYLDAHLKRLPLEFRILHYAPRHWEPLDSLVIFYQMVETLSTSPNSAIEREKILAKLGPELTADLYVNASWRDHPPTAPVPSLDVIPSQTQPGSPASVTSILSEPTAALFAPWLNPFLRHESAALGSNNWVISGAHTVSGKPLLSNDPHLGHQMPNLWYEVHLRSGEFDAAGVALPGCPYIVLGHNRRIAWGFTNLGPTVEDAFVETFNATGEYLTPEGWKQPERRREVIHVKDHPDVVMDVESTRHGPIMNELIPGEARKIALRWTFYDGVRIPLFRVDSAKNWEDFRRALSEFDAPGQNVVYADVDGNIGYQATGKVPIRAAGDGSLPVDGSNNAHEWTGYVPYDKLPSILNPPSGVIATANSRITPDGYPYSISVEWEAPWRTDRIYRVLQSGKKLSRDDMLALQMDVYSELDQFVADKLVYAVDHASKASAQARKAADVLRRWNGQMEANSAAPTIETHARNELMQMLLEAKLGSEWANYHWTMETVWLESVLDHQPARWLPPNFPNYEDFLTAALEAALKLAPQDLASWKWGPQQSVTIQNPVLGRSPILRRWTGPGTVPQSGSEFTVKAAGRDYGPSERFTADLSNLDASTLNLVTGEAGNFLSPYYMDQWKAWHNGYTFALPFSKTAVENSAMHRLMLQPR